MMLLLSSLQKSLSLNFLAAITRKKREREISEENYRIAVDNFKKDWEVLYVIGELTDDVVAETERLIESYPLRGFDAIHLATAVISIRELKIDFTFVCSDENLLKAASREKFETINPSKNKM